MIERAYIRRMARYNLHCMLTPAGGKPADTDLTFPPD
jgi:hypothetical protein